MFSIQYLRENKHTLDTMIKNYLKDCPIPIFMNPRLDYSLITQIRPNVVHIEFVIEDKVMNLSPRYHLVYRLLPTGIAHSEFLQFANLIYVYPVQQWLDYLESREKATQFISSIKEELMATVWTPERVEKWITSGMDID